MDRNGYIESEVKSTLAAVNRFLLDGGAGFAIPESDLERFGFSSDSSANAYQLTEKDINDIYSQGRRVGAIFHQYFNRAVFSSPSKKAEKIKRVVQHAFAMLNVLREDPEADVLQMQVIYPSAKDTPMAYSIMDEDNPHLEKKTADFIRQEGGDDEDTLDGVEDALNNLRDILGQQPRRLQKPFKGSDENANEQLGISSPSFEAGDVTGYGSVENIGGLSDNPWDIRADKRRREEFNIARIIIEGRGERNWRKVLKEVLISDEATAIRYLAGIYHY